MNDNAGPPTPDALVERYIAMRNEKKRWEDQFEQAMEERFGNPMKELEATMLGMLNTMGIDSIAGPSGTVYRKLNTSVTVADGAEFRRHIIGLEAWDLVDWRPNKTAVNELIDNGEPLPPGLNRNTFFNVGFRKKS